MLAERDAHHLFRVLRARDGEEVVLTNGAGVVSFGVVRDGTIARVSDLLEDPPLEPIELYLAPLKGDRSEWAVQKATELGVTLIVPLLSERVVANWKGEHALKHLRKWRAVADEACAQCRRSRDVVIADPVRVHDVSAHVAVCDFDGAAALSDVRAVAVGPEGGWGDSEWTSDRLRLGLGELVLRAETAAVAVTTLIASQGSGWSRPGFPGSIGHDGES